MIEGVVHDDETEEITVRCRLRKGVRRRCGHCGELASLYDRGERRRRWRALDAGTIRVFIEADAPRVDCETCEVTVAAVPWARRWWS